MAVSTDRDDYEFIEILNIGMQPVDLTGVHFSSGITYAFSENSLLDPGARAVLVKDSAAFAERYGAVAVSGEYSGRLSNDGELLTLSLTGFGTLRSFSYNDRPDWPTLADGHGFSMVLVNPESNPDSSEAGNWAAHSVVGGAPGAADTHQSSYGNWKLVNGVVSDLADDEGDGLVALAEYALGTSPVSSSAGFLPFPGVVQVTGEDYLTISYLKNPLAADVTFQLQTSSDLKIWTAAESINVSPDVFRISTPVVEGGEQYLRLVLSIK